MCRRQEATAGIKRLRRCGTDSLVFTSAQGRVRGFLIFYHYRWFTVINAFAVNYKIQILSLCFRDGFATNNKQENCKEKTAQNTKKKPICDPRR